MARNGAVRSVTIRLMIPMSAPYPAQQQDMWSRHRERRHAASPAARRAICKRRQSVAYAWMCKCVESPRRDHAVPQGSLAGRLADVVDVCRYRCCCSVWTVSHPNCWRSAPRRRSPRCTSDLGPGPPIPTSSDRWPSKWVCPTAKAEVAERHRAAVRVDEQVWRDAIRGFSGYPL